MRRHLSLCIAILFTAAGAWPASHAHASYPRPALRAAAAQFDVGPYVMSWTGAIRNFAIGDWTGDGRPDLMTNLTTPGEAAVVMFQENVMATGSPQLFRQVAPPVGFDPPFNLDLVAIGDLNGDGRGDLVMVAGGDPVVTVQLSTPGGGLGPPAFHTIPNSDFITNGPWIEDLDADGDLDILVSGVHGLAPDSFGILKNAGNGTLSLGQWFTIATSGHIECIGDLNQDGKPDLVAAATSDDRIYVYRTTGDPLDYVVSAVEALPGLASRIAKADADDLPDLVVLGVNQLELHHGLPGGLFDAASDLVPLAPGSSLRTMDAGNLSGDSRSEVVVAYSDLDNDNPHANVEVVDLSAPLAPHVFLSAGHSPYGVQIAHLDRDDIADLVVRLTGEETRNLAILLGPIGQDRGLEVPIGLSASYQELGTPCVGDFNRDGAPDIAAPAGTTTTILLGNGAGAFPTTTATDARTGDRLFTCDLNRDGKLDLLRSERSTTSVYWQPGNGNGTFGTAFLIANTDPTIPRHPIADLNGDGKDDLIMFEPNGISILAGNGSGGIAAGYAPVLTGATPRDAVAVDMDRDGDLDLAVATDDGVRLFRNDGVPAFTFMGTSAGNRAYTAIATGDLNRDGRPDLVAHERISGTWQRPDVGITVLGYDGAWTLISMRFVGAAEREGIMLEVWDVNRDGLPDIVSSEVNNLYAANAPVTTSVYLQKSPDGYSPRLTYLHGSIWSNSSSPLSGGGFTTVGDADGDGQRDIVGLMSEATTPYVSIAQGNAFPGGWGPGGQTDNPVAGQPMAMASGDMDQDGIPDLVTANYVDGSVSLLRGNGNGTFQSPYTFTDARLAGVTGLTLADMNRDGALDVIAVGGPICVILGNVGGLFQSFVFGTLIEYPGGSGLNDVEVADLNRDGYPDIIASSYFNSTVICHMTGPSGFTTTISSLPGYNSGIEVADMNRDGLLDIVIVNNASGPIVFRALRIAEGKGDGTFQGNVGLAWSWPSTAVQFAFGIAAADVNRDGKMDVVVGTNDPGHNTTPVYLVYGNGTGGFSSDVAYPAGGQTDFLEIGDLDGDPWPDLVSSSWEEGMLSVRLGNGSGGFGPRMDAGTSSGAQGLVLDDLDRDGLNDLAFAGSFQNRVSVLLNTHTNITAAPVLEAPRAAGRLAQNAPNPFNPRTAIRFTVPTAGRGSLTIYDVHGRRVAIPVQGELTAGDHGIVWDGEDSARRPMPSGVYFYRLETPGFTATRRMTLLR